MANNILISTPARNAALDSVTALLNAGGAGTIKIYDGTQPAGPGTAVTTQVLLVTLTLSADAFGDSASGTATADTITSGTAVATGTATWMRWASGAGTAVFDGTVGTSGTDLVLGTASINSGNVVAISSFTLTHPA